MPLVHQLRVSQGDAVHDPSAQNKNRIIYYVKTEDYCEYTGYDVYSFHLNG